MTQETLETIYEVVSIKQVKRKLSKKYEHLLNFKLTSPDNVARFVQEFIGDEDREVFLVLCLSTKNQVTAVHRCSVGSINSAVVHPREVFKTAFLNNAASIIVAHVHPSGVVTPSPEDIEVTERLRDCGYLLGVDLLDHLIVTDSNFLSLKQKGYM